MEFAQLVEHMNKLPEGVALEDRQMRVTAIMGLAASMKIPMTPNPLPPSELSTYFYDNAQLLRKRLFKINECFPFNVDRSLDIACRIYARRHFVAFQPTTADLLGNAKLFGEDIVPEIDKLKIVSQDITFACEFLCESAE